MGDRLATIDMDRKEGAAMPFPRESWAPSNTVWPEPTINIYLRTAAWIKMPLGTAVGLGADNIALNGDPAPLLKKGTEHPPQFSAHIYCGQTAGCIKMVLGMGVGLGPGHIELDEDPAPLFKKGTEPPPQFSAHF